MIVEDIHWADESTRHLLRFLARALTDASVMIIATYRSDELTCRHPLASVPRRGRPLLRDRTHSMCRLLIVPRSPSCSPS